MERVFGAETEYAISHLAPEGQKAARRLLLRQMMDIAAREIPSIPAADGRGLFLSNGGRLDVDLTDHPEYATPECTTPVELVRKLRESDAILSSLAERLTVELGGDVMVTKTNVDYASANTWGAHESYAIRRGQEINRNLISFLCSRVIFTGSGGWNNLAPGLEFTLSPRVPHLKRIVSTESTHSRGLIHDASSRGRQVDRETDHRIHLTIGESLSSEVALVLKAGTTALVVALIEASVNPGEGVELAKPLVAIQAFSRDASCRQSAEIKGRRRLRAIDIQRHYLRLAEQQVGALPVWAGAVLQLWAQVLDGLEDGSEQQRMRLEWVIRRKVFERYLTSRGFDWSNLPAGHEKADLFELDNKLGRVGRAGMFPLLDQLGALNHRIDVTGFPKEPVPTRATVRGKAIGACFASGLTDSCRGDWNYILDRKNRMVLDLGDPFETCLNWRPKAETLGFDFHAWGLR